MRGTTRRTATKQQVARWAVAAGAAAALTLVTAGCGGGKEVTFTPAAQSGTIVPADGTAPTTSTSAPGPASSTSSGAAALPPNLEVTRQGSSVCVRDKGTGSQACVGDHGTAVVNGVVIVDGTVVGASGGSGGSVVVGGGARGTAAAPVPTSGQVRLSGAVSWQGTAKGTCRRTGDVRHAEVTVADGGRLQVNAVGTGVVNLELAVGGDSYAGNWVGESGTVTLGDKSLTVNGARVGRGDRVVRVDATLDC